MSKRPSVPIPADPMQTHGTRTVMLPDSQVPTVDRADAPTLTRNPGDLIPKRRDPVESAYILRRLVGRGGQGEVWEANQTVLKRTVAIKRIRPDLVARLENESSSLSQAFREEALIVARLDHPNIIPIYDLEFESDGTPLLAMKLIQGTPWNQLLEQDFQKRTTMEARLVRHVEILAAVANAVSFAHSRGVIHRDIKPSQVVVGEFGEVFLTDWGLSILAGDYEDSPMQSLFDELRTPKSAPNPAGTPAYMAPEQTDETGDRLGTWTDVYLLGGCLYQILTGSPPHGRKGDGAQAMNRARLGKVDDVREFSLGADPPAELMELLRWSLESDPKLRTLSARSFSEKLQDFLRGGGRRREAAEILSRVEARISSISSYPEFIRAIGEVDRAAGLWPENEKVALLQRQLTSGMVSDAVAHGDVELATQFLSDVDPAEQEALAAASENLKKTRKRAATMARVVATSLVLLVLVMIFSAHELGKAIEIQSKNETRNERLLELRGDLLSNNLLMMAEVRASILEGKSHVPKFDELKADYTGMMNEASALSTPAIADKLRSADGASLKLIALRELAIHQALQGESEEAEKTVASPQHNEGRREFANGMESFLVAVREHIEAEVSVQRRQIRTTQVTLVVTALLVGILALAAIFLPTIKGKTLLKS